jgi:hypothetical protein
MKLPLFNNTRIHATEGHFGNSHRSTIGRMFKDRTSLSLDASLAIPTHVLRFEVSCAWIRLCLPSLWPWFCGSTK